MDKDNIQDSKNQESKATRTYTIHISGKQVKVDHPTATGRELKQFGEVPEGNDLFLKEPGGHDRGITDDESVSLKNGMHFYDLPPSNLGAGQP